MNSLIQALTEAEPEDLPVDGIAETRCLNVGMVCWEAGDGMAEKYADQLSTLGHDPHLFLATEPLPAGLDAVLTWGPLGSLVPIAQQLLELEPNSRPPFGLLLTEQLPNPSLPEWWRYTAGSLRSWLERRYYRRTDTGWQPAAHLSWLTSRMKRYRYYGGLFWLQRQGVLSGLAVWSTWTANYLRQRGIDAFVPQRACDPSWGRDLGLERDIPVLWLGKPGSARRKKLLKNIRQELGKRGIQMMVVDGVENPYVFREERTVLLNRSRIVLNLLRQKWDDNALRFELAAYNKAMIVSEPMLPHTPYIPGVHLVEAPPAKIPEVIIHYLQHEDERALVANHAYEFVMSGGPKSLVMADFLGKTMEAGRKQREARPQA